MADPADVILFTVAGESSAAFSGSSPTSRAKCACAGWPGDSLEHTGKHLYHAKGLSLGNKAYFDQLQLLAGICTQTVDRSVTWTRSCRTGPTACCCSRTDINAAQQRVSAHVNVQCVRDAQWRVVLHHDTAWRVWRQGRLQRSRRPRWRDGC